MNISIIDFKNIVTTGACHAAGLHAIPRVHAIALKQYCQKLTSRSACSQQCPTCALQIQQAVADVSRMQGVRLPYAMYTWKLKDALARTMDAISHQKQAGVTRARTRFGEPGQADGLDLFLEGLDG